MNAKIVITELQEIKLASVSHIGDFNKMESSFQMLMKWAHKKKLVASAGLKAITIYHDNPNVTQLSKVRFSTCLRVANKIKEDGAIRPLKINKGIYALGHFEIEAEDIGLAWKNMSVWVLENGYEFRDGDFFEIYHNDHRNHPEQKFIIDICIPLEKTNIVSLDKVRFENFSSNKNQLDYRDLVNYMKELKLFFHKEHDTLFKLGKINQGSSDFTYFSITPEKLKSQKLKFVLILDHKNSCFTICLSGQNKTIRKKYWEIFKGSDWKKYHLAETIHNSLMIIDHTIVENPDFGNKNLLNQKIEREALQFINDLRAILE